MEKALVLENGSVIDIPDELIDYLKRENIEFEHYNMRERFWPKNRNETIKFFSSLPEGQELYCHTVFDGFQQLELMIELLHSLKHKKFTFKIMHGCLAESLIKFYEKEESSITPLELEKELDEAQGDKAVKAVFGKIYLFKKKINKKFLEVMESHNIYWLRSKKYQHLFKSLADIHSLL